MVPSGVGSTWEWTRRERRPFTRHLRLSPSSQTWHRLQRRLLGRHALVPDSGITTKELMARIGHASPRAALIYQHATEQRDREIAAYLDQAIPEP